MNPELPNLSSMVVYPTKAAVRSMAANDISWAEVLQTIGAPDQIRDNDRRKKNSDRFLKVSRGDITVVITSVADFDRHDTDQLFPLYAVITTTRSH